MIHSPFTANKEFTPYIRPEQMPRIKGRVARHLREYRKYLRIVGLPRLKRAPDWSGFETEIEGGPVYFYPVIRKTPSIGGRQMDMHWNASIETYTPGGQWHPPESDERVLCTARCLIEAAFCARALIQLESLRNTISDDELCQLHFAHP